MSAKVPLPYEVVEFSHTVYDALYSDDQDAIKEMEEWREASKNFSSEERAYWRVYKVAARRLAKNIRKQEKRYGFRRGVIEDKREKRLQKAEEIRDVTLSDIKKTDELLNALFERASPTVIVAAASEVLQAFEIVNRAPALTILTAGITATAAHMYLKKYGRTLREKEIDVFYNRIKGAEAEYRREMQELEKFDDERLKIYYERAEAKTRKAYENRLGVIPEVQPIPQEIRKREEVLATQYVDGMRMRANGFPKLR